ncbi:MAG: hypothetical protein RLP15_13955 [Cryomorphaceae bacterium]
MRTNRLYGRLLGLLLLIGIAGGCSSGSDADVDQLTSENERLRKQVKAQDSVVTRIGVGAKFVNAYLDSLENLESAIRRDLASQAADSVIVGKVKSMTSLVSLNRHIVQDLRSSLGEGNLAAQLLLDHVVRLDTKVKAQELKIAMMNKDLKELGAELSGVLGEYADLQTEYDLQSRGMRQMKDQVKNLEVELTKKEEELDVRERKLNTAYYFFGTKKELLSMNIIKKANLLTFELNEDIKLTQLNKVDTRVFDALTIPTKGLKIMSDHPAASYTITEINGSSSIRISDQVAFWSITKTLIIQTEG